MKTPRQLPQLPPMMLSATLAACALATLLGGCSAPRGAGPLPNVVATDRITQLRWLDRVTWGASTSAEAALDKQGLPAWLRDQLHPGPAKLPVAAQAQIDGMSISQMPVEQLAMGFDAQRKAADALADEDQKKTAREAYRQQSQRLVREPQQRFLLRALYSPNQLQEQMTWFWMNHFNVNARKADIRALIGDYEENAIRPHALGKFRDLLGATQRHPAMLRYLDNAQNTANRINENYARELMELHTMGVGSGYSQGDVQELARVLTGVGIASLNAGAPPPSVRPGLRGDYVRQGLFEFNPNRHDEGPKTLLGQTMTQRGLAEVDEALDRLARAPATARFISTRLAMYLVADVPPPALVDRMSATFRRSDGDIAAVLTTMFESPEFAASLGGKFRDPAHYVIGSVRLAYDDRVVTDLNPMIDWLNRMGETLYAHETPDGYSLTQDAWASSGQMTTRFDIARAIGASGAMLFRTEDKAPLEKPAFPPLAESSAVRVRLPTFSAGTRGALAEAKTPQEWNTFLLSSPENMHR